MTYGGSLVRLAKDLYGGASSGYGGRRITVDGGTLGSAYVGTGRALSDSVEGRALVDAGGDTVAPSQGVDMPCTVNVRAGDTVIITLVSGAPTVTGVVGRGDQQQGEIDGAQSSADAANKRAEEARRFAEEVDGKVSDAQADMDAAKRQAEQAKAAADAASRKADQTAADVDRKVKAAADAATQASANASAAAAKADQLSGKVTDVTTTVSGLSTKVEGAARDATSALTASSKTSQSLGALTSTIEQHYTEQQATAGKADRAARDAASSLDRVSKVEQTAAGIQTQVTAASKTAADALSKASTAQQTADAITTKVSKEYTSTRDADAKYASQSQLTQTAEGLTSKVTTAQRTADAAKTAASTAKQTADGLTATVEAHYTEQLRTDKKATDAATAAGSAQRTADAAGTRAQTAVDKATTAQTTADGVKVQVTKAQSDASAALKSASAAKQTADAITATVARDYLSKADASKSYASKSSVTQTADGIRSEVASTYQTKAGMSAYAEKSYVDQKAGSITQSVEAVMATANGAASSASRANSDLAALSKMATKTYTFATANIKGKYWTRLGSLVSGGDWSNFAIEVMSGNGYNGSSSQNSRMTIVIKDGFQGKPAAYGAFGVSVLRENCQGARVAVMASAGNTCDVWVYLPWQYANGQYTISGAYRSWTQSVLSQADAPTSGVAQDVAYRLNAEQLKADVADTYTTKTEFRQTADAITATVAKKLDSATAASTYAKSSELKQTADGLSVRVTKAQGAADAASSAASSANSAANDAKATAATAKATASSAASSASRAQATADSKVGKGSSGISSLETAMQFDSSGLSIFKKVNGAIQGFIAKVTGSAFQICDKSGTVLSRFADNRIDLGRNSQDTTISMCQDNVRIYSSSKGGAGSKGEVNASYILCDAPVGANNRSSFSIGFGAFSDNPANDMPRETPYVTLGVDDAHGGDSVTIGAQSVRVNWVDWTARHGQATGTGQYPNLARWACSGGLCTVSITHCLDGDLPSWRSRTLATGLPRTAGRAWNLACTQQLPDGTLRDLQVVVEPDGDSPGKAAKVTLTQKGGPGIPHGSWLFVSGTYPLAQDGDWYEPFG